MSAINPVAAFADPAAQSREALRRVEAWAARQRLLGIQLDEQGRPVEVQEPGGNAAHYSYNSAGDLICIDEPDAGRVEFEYDDARRLAGVTHPDGEVTRYAYGGNNRLREISSRGLRFEFDHDDAGRLTCARRGNAGAAVFRYDTEGRVIEGRTARVTTAQQFDDAGRVASIHQTLDDVCLTLLLSYDAAGRLAALEMPGSSVPIRYAWDERGWPAAVSLGEREIARFEYRREEKFCAIRFANGVNTESWSDAIDGRLRRQTITRGDEVLARRELDYHASGQISQDGSRRYDYDEIGRLLAATCLATGRVWNYEYDTRDNRTAAGGDDFLYDSQDRLAQLRRADGEITSLRYDHWGRLTAKSDSRAEIVYRYDDAGQLVQALRDGELLARFTYDHKGRLAAMQTDRGVERYLYGPADELFCVSDETGRPLRLSVRTPFGCIAEIHGPVDCGPVFFVHEDERGVCRLVTDEAGQPVIRPQVDPFGAPLSPDAECAPWSFGARRWNAAVNLYYFGSRWYDPVLGRFLTPDSYTARPDDARLVHAIGDAAAQVRWRTDLLPDWLRHPRARHRYVYCGNDPINCVDPNGHWSFGGGLLSLLGAIWTLPNTLFGLLVEITCLVGEVIRWIVWLVTLGNVSWATPGIDVAASGRLNAFALVFTGGWLGSFSNLLGITFGNVFFVYKDWRDNPSIAAGGNVSPSAYGGTVSFPISEALYEHELRHTNQYGWFGPFFHLGLPVFGIYEWDVILNGYQNSWLERDAFEHGGF